MVEYGNGVGEVAGRSGGGGSGGQSMDVGASLGQIVNDSVHTISSLPPTTLLIGVIVIVFGLIMLRRVF
jgi:hypothetical protein